ncbi:hypothetical protein GCM10008955_07060 [Deinococcus malanensis]|uniref:Nucleotide exchange factor GrpE n=1 Tax=Deinococcus malanensis TaxID=1706855 RepID=A0ABQ2EQC5_9DEIO|nr:hypothetical protein [Deinococcus malanensis]GGK16226.1 hypothetical protein GCM10008955_07060 [Deinococcus malanensis]
MTNPNPESGDVNQGEQINDGMQGADGSVDANGMNPSVNAQEKLEELRENLGDLSDE